MTLNELEQQVEFIKAEIEKLKAEGVHKDIKPWRAKYDEEYFALGANGHVVDICETADKWDCEHYSIGNYYRTCKLAEQDAKELALRGKIRQLRDVLCEGCTYTAHENIWIIGFSPERNKYVPCLFGMNPIGAICFDTKEHAQQACDILNNYELKGRVNNV